MTSPIFKIGDTIKVVSRLFEDDGTPFPINTKVIRSVLKKGAEEIVGVNQLVDNFTVTTIFQTNAASTGRYQTDIRFTEGTESFSTPVVVVDLGPRIS